MLSPYSLNQYVNITVGANPTVTMAYDANGNLTGDGSWTFAYDAQNMLRSAVSAASTSTYQYDPLGRRQMLTEGGVTTTFLHDGDEEIADYAAAAVLRRYVPGPGTDMPIAMVTPSGGSNTRKYFHTNRQGSTIAMSADDGTLSEGPYTYDAYGNGAPATGVPFKYTGRRLDAGTGLYYYRARYYSTALGRFLQVDPVGYADQTNLYAYVGNDPANATDPTGNYIESGVDLLFIAIDVAAIVYDNATTGGENSVENYAALTADLAGLAIPGATGLGVASRIATRTAGHGAAQAGSRGTARAAKALTCCFVAGTLVETKEGLRPIEKIEVGDLVLARDEETGETAYKPVTKLVRRHNREIWKLTLVGTANDGKAVNSVLDATDDHPWRSVVGTWLKTMELKPGMEILRARGPPARVVSVENTKKREPTFNLEVAEFHTYFAGNVRAWVHNACNVKSKLPNNRLSAPPPAPGRPPIGDDGKPVELHHEGGSGGNLVEKTQQEHRGPGNYGANHGPNHKPLTPAERQQHNRDREEYWRQEQESGRFDDLNK